MTTGAAYFLAIPLALASLVAVPGPAYSLDDVLGWEGTTWEMRESEVAAYVKSRGYDLVPGQPGPGGTVAHYVPFHTTGDVGGSACTVVFHFSERTLRLNAVVVGGIDQFRERAVKLHTSLLNRLTVRYGPPTAAESRGTVALVTQWAFRTTRIALRLDTDTGGRGHHATQVSVLYSPTASDERDADERLLLLALLKLLGEGRRP
jgi:hypothetical protein